MQNSFILCCCHPSEGSQKSFQLLSTKVKDEHYNCIMVFQQVPERSAQLHLHKSCYSSLLTTAISSAGLPSLTYISSLPLPDGSLAIWKGHRNHISATNMTEEQIVVAHIFLWSWRIPSQCFPFQALHIINSGIQIILFSRYSISKEDRQHFSPPTFIVICKD